MTRPIRFIHVRWTGVYALTVRARSYFSQHHTTAKSQKVLNVTSPAYIIHHNLIVTNILDVDCRWWCLPLHAVGCDRID